MKLGDKGYKLVELPVYQARMMAKRAELAAQGGLGAAAAAATVATAAAAAGSGVGLGGEQGGGAVDAGVTMTAADFGDEEDELGKVVEAFKMLYDIVVSGRGAGNWGTCGCAMPPHCCTGFWRSALSRILTCAFWRACWPFCSFVSVWSAGGWAMAAWV